ncbi:hypothetical protein J3458_004377 [Metarhizium acridum]|uniref:uncharacterized protein n=1 Tax=Metarhizium acridum TaxID=92637 RepID=UPI001C6B0914|nr:hypothetical protein J3458_004377 [Metarhizium acridum]
MRIGRGSADVVETQERLTADLCVDMTIFENVCLLFCWWGRGEEGKLILGTWEPCERKTAPSQPLVCLSATSKFQPSGHSHSNMQSHWVFSTRSFGTALTKRV